MDSEVIETFRTADSSIVSDALDQYGIDGVATEIGAVDPSQAAVGRAHTLRFEPVSEPGSKTNFPYALLEELRADRILAIDGVGPELSCWGGNACVLAERAGVEGVVVDGGYRDVPDIRSGTFPVFGRAPTPKTGQRRLTVEEVGGTIDIGGVAVSADDVIVADGTGVVVVPAERASEVAATVAEIHSEESVIEEKIDAGATVADLEDDDHEF